VPYNSKTEFAYCEQFRSIEELQIKLVDYDWFKIIRFHSPLGYKTPVETRESGSIIPSKNV